MPMIVGKQRATITGRNRLTPDSFLPAKSRDEDVRTVEVFEINQTLSWTEVNRVHRVRNGVYQQNGTLISLLTDFGRINPCYPDRYGNSEDIINYTGAGRHGDQQLDPPNRALLAAIDTGTIVPLFNKLSPGRWQFMGNWQVIAGKYLFNDSEKRMLWGFSLRRRP